MSDQRSTLDDYKAIGQESSSALALVAHLMQRSAEETDRVQDAILASVEQERDEWKKRAQSAERCLFLAQQRLLALFDDEEPT